VPNTAGIGSLPHDISAQVNDPVGDASDTTANVVNCAPNRQVRPKASLLALTTERSSISVVMNAMVPETMTVAACPTLSS
jgi:hypothetical protein